MLEHIRVVDLCDGISQFAGHILARLGAEVIAVEPTVGVSTRHMGPFAGDEPDPDCSLTHWAYNRGKQSLVLDIDSSEGHSRFCELIASADILFEDCRPGYLGSLDLAYEDLAEVNPGLIHASITPYGSEGPRSHWLGTDLTAVAGSSFLHASGDADRAPLRVGLPHSFLHGSADAAAASLIALQERDRSGTGQHIDVSAQESVTIGFPQNVAPMENALAADRIAGGISLGGMDIPLLFPCSDGYTICVILPGAAFAPFCRRLTQWLNDEGADDENLHAIDWDNVGVQLFAGEVSFDIVAQAFATYGKFLATKSKAELWEAALNRNLLITPSMTIADLVGYEHLDARGFWDFESTARGNQAQHPGALVKFRNSPIELRGSPPTLGQHNGAVITDRETNFNVSKPESDSLPLEGLKVVEFSWVIATPSAVRILCDYGADVVKVETVSRPDTMRTVNPFVNEDPHPDNSVGYGVYNAGKRSLSLDLSKPEAKEVVLDLIRWADIVTESFAPGAMERLGFGYDVLSEINPGLIMLSSSLLGQTGPHSGLAGYGFMAAAIAGYYELTGWSDRPPSGPYGPYTDFLAPRIVVSTLMAALENRKTTGRGEYIDLSQTECALHYLAPAILDQSVNGRTIQRQGNDDPQMFPHGVFPSKGDDSWLAVACSDESWPALAATVGLGERKDLNQAERREQRSLIDDAVATWTSERDNNSGAEELQDVGVAAYPVHDAAGTNTDPQLGHRQHQIQVPQSHAGSMWTHSCRTKMSRTPAVLTRGGPCLGEDNFEVLSEWLGYSVEQIADLAAAEVLE
ncbi:MAG: CoA transferase [Actinomycetota bacterium]|nr:CoA transferase [Actinomycetota bacterium]